MLNFIISITAAILGVLSLVPQFQQLIKTKLARDINLLFVLMTAVAVTLTMYLTFATSDNVFFKIERVIITAGFWALFGTVLYYKHGKSFRLRLKAAWRVLTTGIDQFDGQ